jgi:hypothetical protein
VGEEVELLGEQGLVVVQLVAEQREGLDEGPPAQDDLRATTGDAVQGREPLVDAHRVVAGQHGHGGPEAQPLGASGDGREHDVRRGDREVGAVVLPDAQDVDADLVREHALLDDLPQGRRGVLEVAVGAERDVAEGVEAELEVHGSHLRRVRPHPTV